MFARIADELGRRRPDIPILVVEGRGTERTLVDCGIDLRVHGNVSLMANTPDPRHFWGVTRVCLMPSLWAKANHWWPSRRWRTESPSSVLTGAVYPSVLGNAGIVLSLPNRLAPTSCVLPTSEEVSPWVEAVVKLWDDEAHYTEQCRLALDESSRWAPGAIEPLYSEFFSEVSPGASPFRKCGGLCGPGDGEECAAKPLVKKSACTEPLLECWHRFHPLPGRRHNPRPS